MFEKPFQNVKKMGIYEKKNQPFDAKFFVIHF